MRTNYNRQSRRVGRCFRTPSSRPHELAVSPRRLALTAADDDLSGVAEAIAAELELSDEVLDLLYDWVPRRRRA